MTEQEKRTLILRDPNIRGGFAQLPTVVLRDPKLTGNEKTLYGLLLSYAWQDRECFPGQCRLATDMGVSKSTLARLLGRLRKVKLISWKQLGLGKTNIYFIEQLSDGYLAPQLIDKGLR